MTRLDSITLEIPTHCLTSFSQYDSRVTKSIKEKIVDDKMHTTTDFFVGGVGDYGIGRSKLNDNSLELNFSAKILLDNYLDGINQNTITQALETYNSISPISIDVNSALELAHIHKVDSTQMIYPAYDIDLCWRSLMVYGSNSKFKIFPYTKPNNKGLVFNGIAKSEKRRLIFYDKYLCLLNDKRGSAFLNNCSDAMRIVNDSQNALRVELNHTSHKSIRDRFKVTTNSLAAVLNSVSTPNYDFMRKVADGAKQLNLFPSDWDGLSWSSIRKLEGDKGICARLDWNIDLISEAIKSRMHEKTAYSRIREMKIFIQSIREKASLGDDFNKTDSINEHILELIKTA